MKNFVTTTRVDIKDVATIAAFLVRNGTQIAYRTQPIVTGFKMSAELVRANHPSLTFTTAEAFQYLKSLGIDSAKGNRGVRSLIKDLQHQSLDEYVAGDQSKTDVAPINSECVISEEDTEIAKARRDKELAEQMEQFKKISGLLVEDNE